MSPNVVYRAVPWVGIYEANLERTRRADKYLVLSYIFFLTITYLFYGACFTVWNQLFFDGRPLAVGDSQNYYPYLEIVELFLLVFVRTRVSIMYFPKVITVLNVLYLFYVYCNFFPFSGLSVGALTCCSMLVFVLFLKYFELPAAQWNPFGPHTPSANNPRQAYIPTPQARFSLGFDLWSLFYAPTLRSGFGPEEQTEVGTEAEPIQFDFSAGDESVGEVADQNGNGPHVPPPPQDVPVPLN